MVAVEMVEEVKVEVMVVDILHLRQHEVALEENLPSHPNKVCTCQFH